MDENVLSARDFVVPTERYVFFRKVKGDRCGMDIVVLDDDVSMDE